MTANWTHDAGREPGARIIGGSASRLALAALACAGAFALGARHGAGSDEVEQLRFEAGSAAARQRELESRVARQHAELLRAEGELESLQLQLEGIELQLDGVDYLSRQVRDELGLPPSEGTWRGAPATDGTGGGDAAAVDADRLGVARARLAEGLRELTTLLQDARSRDTAPSGSPSTPAESAWRDPANWPARGPVTSVFGWRIFRGVPQFHTGLDIALDYGTPVASTGDGLVLGSGWQRGFGWCVFVQHAHGYHTLYAHLSQVAVEVGDTVAPGSLVGLSGSSGNSTGPHLHYEIWKDGRLVDPRPSMDGTGSR